MLLRSIDYKPLLSGKGKGWYQAFVYQAGCIQKGQARRVSKKSLEEVQGVFRNLKNRKEFASSV